MQNGVSPILGAVAVFAEVFGQGLKFLIHKRAPGAKRQDSSGFLSRNSVSIWRALKRR